MTTDNYGNELHVGDEVVDEGGQNGVGTIVKLESPHSVLADWRSHRFEGVARGSIGVRWLRRVKQAKTEKAKQ